MILNIGLPPIKDRCFFRLHILIKIYLVCQSLSCKDKNQFAPLSYLKDTQMQTNVDVDATLYN